MLKILNELSELIYMSDIDTYELLFVNEPGLELFGITEFKGQKCYKVLQNLDSPCPFCTNKLLSADKIYTWEFTNQPTKKHFLLKDKLSEWEGRLVRLEIAFDLTIIESQKTELLNSLIAENLLVECAKVLYGSGYSNVALDKVLSLIGNFTEASRAYIFEIEDDFMSNTYEWCNEGVSPEKNNLQLLPISKIDRWQDRFQRQEHVLIENIESIKTLSPDEYATLSNQSIKSLIASPMWFDNKLIGYIGFDNYATHKLPNAPAILSTVGYFVGSVLRHSHTLKKLEEMSFRDLLTGTMNRNAFVESLEQFSHNLSIPYGIIYVDVNGMKRLNDTRGHLHGDHVLMETAKNLISVFGANRSYRIGGDEFAVLCPDISNDTFNEQVNALKVLLDSNTEFSCSLGASWAQSGDEINAAISIADATMYAAKRQYYYLSNNSDCLK